MSIDQSPQEQDWMVLTPVLRRARDISGWLVLTSPRLGINQKKKKKKRKEKKRKGNRKHTVYSEAQNWNDSFLFSSNRSQIKLWDLDR